MSSFLAPHGNWRQEDGSRSSAPAILLFSASLFIPFRSAQHASVNQLTKSCMDFLSFILLSKNMIMIIVQTELNALRGMKGVNFDS
jgi:hypothetical protein